MLLTPVNDENPTRVRKKLKSPEKDTRRTNGGTPHSGRKAQGKLNSIQLTAVQASWDCEARKRREVPAACAPCPRRWGDGARIA